MLKFAVAYAVVERGPDSSMAEFPHPNPVLSEGICYISARIQ